MPFWPFPFKLRKQIPARHELGLNSVDTEKAPPPLKPNENKSASQSPQVLRYFYNLPGSQCYASFFPYWGGILTAGHVMTDTNYTSPPFATGAVRAWPDGLDAALIGAHVPRECPADPHAGQDVICLGYPAGARQIEHRTARVYMPRPGAPDTWIAQIFEPDEPVVTGMSGGPVLDARTNTPIGILITRNSPADLNHDRDPDESFDFVSLSGLWKAVRQQQTFI